MKHRNTGIALLLALALMVSGCGAKNPSSAASAASSTAPMGYAADSAGRDMADAIQEVAAESEMQMESPAPLTASVALDSQKMVYTVDLQLQSISFDQGVDAVSQRVSALDGFVERSYVEGKSIYDEYRRRTANMTVRIPAAKLDEFIEALKTDFNVVSQQKHATNISAEYYDTESRLKSLRIQEERLIAMLEGATELQYMLEVQRELSDINYQIENLTSAIQRMNSSVSQSTVNLYLEEVFEYAQEVAAPVTFGTRAAQTMSRTWINFKNFCQNVVLFFIAGIPIWLFLAVLAVIVLAVLRRRKRKLQEKPEKIMANVHTLPTKPEPGDPDDNRPE